ncbi:MAG: N-acetylmuramoyl-L-alanine amidase [Bacteroides sp.]|nr:N-acetylmuramoyl-L-alanine amidase [Bacteroides sp.]
MKNQTSDQPLSSVRKSPYRTERRIHLIVIHCSATRDGVPYTPEQLERDHRAQGFGGAGYHFYIRRNGNIKTMRDIDRPGAHVRGHNAHSIGICYEGGLDTHGRPADTRTPWQKHSLRVVVAALLADYPGARVCGHRDLSPDLNGNSIVEPHEWTKQCPCFDVEKDL